MHGPKWPFLLMFIHMWTLCGHCELFGTGSIWVELLVQRRLCPIFHEWCRVTQHRQLFRRLTGCQRDTPVLGHHKNDLVLSCHVGHDRGLESFWI